MNRSLKILFLIVILAIPAGIFTFLKFFGDNKFDVEIFHTQGLSEAEGCLNTEGQYVIPDSVLNKADYNRVIAFNTSTDIRTLNNIALRLKDTFGGQTKLFCFVENRRVDEDPVFEFLLTKDLTKTAECGFITKDPDQLVLVDRRNRVRGYYHRDLDEIDRLIVEVKILIENDQRNAK